MAPVFVNFPEDSKTPACEPGAQQLLPQAEDLTFDQSSRSYPHRFAWWLFNGRTPKP